MGIGIALATGLVQGFHQNIQEEKARRQGEQEKLDKYKELVMNASLTSKNFSQTNADMINQMIDLEPEPGQRRRVHYRLLRHDHSRS